MTPEILALLSGRTLERVTVGLTTNCWISTYQPRTWSNGIPMITNPADRNGYRCDAIIYEFSGGTIPRHHTLMHLCEEPRCVNPDHMRIVRRRYNGGRAAKTYTIQDVRARITELRSQERPAVKRPSQTIK